MDPFLQAGFLRDREGENDRARELWIIEEEPGWEKKGKGNRVDTEPLNKMLPAQFHQGPTLQITVKFTPRCSRSAIKEIRYQVLRTKVDVIGMNLQSPRSLHSGGPHALFNVPLSPS